MNAVTFAVKVPLQPVTDPQVLMLLGVISQMPADYQASIHATAEELRAKLRDSELANIAFALVCSEVAAEAAE